MIRTFVRIVFARIIWNSIAQQSIAPLANFRNGMCHQEDGWQPGRPSVSSYNRYRLSLQSTISILHANTQVIKLTWNLDRNTSTATQIRRKKACLMRNSLSALPTTGRPIKNWGKPRNCSCKSLAIRPI